VLEAQFPVQNANDAPIGYHKAPWGRLTARGQAQAWERGARLRQRYSEWLSEHVQHSANVQARASNFVRTQLSAQHFLSGLLASDVGADAAPGPASGAEQPRSSGATGRYLCRAAINVRPTATDNIAAFDSDNGLMEAMRQVFASEEYEQREAGVRAAALALTRAVPYFQPDLVAPIAAGAEPRFMWIRAFDYFCVLREHGTLIPPELAHLEQMTHEHLLWRFRTLFAHPHILRLAIGSLLAEIAGSVAAAAATAVLPGCGGAGPPARSQHHAQPAVALYSGHDVTILPLLYVLAGATRTVHLAFASGRTRRVQHVQQALDAVRWPGYASALTLELRQEVPGGAEGAAAQHREDAMWVAWRFHNDRLGGAAAAPAPGAASLGEQDAGSDGEGDVEVVEELVAAGSVAAGASAGGAGAPATSAAGSMGHQDAGPHDHLQSMRGMLPLAEFLAVAQAVAATGAVGREEPRGDTSQ
jgi:hypothetical protein